MTDVVMTKDAMEGFLTKDQIWRVFKRAYTEDESVSKDGDVTMMELSLDKVLTTGIVSSSFLSGCYSTVISILMNQTKKPFTVYQRIYCSQLNIFQLSALQLCQE